MLLAIRRRLLGASGDDARDQDEGGTTNIHTLLIYSRRKQLREPNCFRIVFHGPAQTASIGASQSDKQGSSRQSAFAPAGTTDAKLALVISQRSIFFLVQDGKAGAFQA